MKIINDLINKAWYRAIKVIYLLSFLAIVTLIIIVFSAGEDFDVLDVQNSKIVCQYGNEKTFLVKDIFNKGEISAPNNYDLRFTTADNERIREFCEIDKNKLLSEGVWKIDGDGRIVSEMFDLGIYGEVIEYHVEKEFKKRYDYLLLSLLITVAVFETIRRIFYYIILGNIKPQK